MSIKKRVGEGLVGAAIGGLAGYATQRDSGDPKDKAVGALTGAALGAGGAVGASHLLRKSIAKHHANKVYGKDYHGFTSSYLGRHINGSDENHQRMNHLSDRMNYFNQKIKQEGLEGESKNAIMEKIRHAKAEHSAIELQMRQHSENVYNQKTKDLKSKMFGVL